MIRLLLGEAKDSSKLTIISGWCLAFLFSMVASCGHKTLIDKRIYNSRGWNLPKTSDLKFISRQVKRYAGVMPDIEVEEYREKDRQTRDEYFILNSYIKKKGKIDPGSFLREYPQRLVIFRVAGEEAILCYLYDRLAEYMPRLELGKTAKGRETIANIVPVDALGSYIVDLDGDGIYESMFDSLFINMDEERSVISVLTFKLDVLKNGKQR